MVAHEAPRDRLQAAESQLLEEQLHERFTFLVPKENLPPGDPGDDMVEVRGARFSQLKGAWFSHGFIAVWINATAKGIPQAIFLSRGLAPFTHPNPVWAGWAGALCVFEFVDVVVDRAPQLDVQKAEFGTIRVDTLREIIANKLTTLLSRTGLKDVVDLYFLEQAGHDLLASIPDAQAKDGGWEPAVIACCSTVFGSANFPPG